jgi:hypothetical protein
MKRRTIGTVRFSPGRLFLFWSLASVTVVFAQTLSYLHIIYNHRYNRYYSQPKKNRQASLRECKVQTADLACISIMR